MTGPVAASPQTGPHLPGAGPGSVERPACTVRWPHAPRGSVRESGDPAGQAAAGLLSADAVLDIHLVKQIQDYARREDHAIMTYVRTDKN